ncbi:hypothetical protein [Encephalitozoon cuniculi GB-M1]|uniref:UPF0329 protein ECU07_0070 n=1 Tax=Encephalitozoon cuniculi (strain GB-M1) TaxID=284813 RepID=Y707_ENCCU|nr:uncharacterized protein ECU07_0070 [Encephalitozoon cuniculi GB-M1]Q8SV54.2 RecName: Full=UPF0329 protein ECU07_0070 [Encephalitozoon cuniculi GB-M1]CAD25539.2 hypothetical protein [Encephalitozoon cuniculi GB-M1]
MARKHAIWRFITLIGTVYCSSQVEHYDTFELEPGDQIILFPFIFKGNNIIALSTTRYRDLDRKRTYLVEDVIDFLGSISHVIWNFTVGRIVCADDNRFQRSFDEIMEGYLKEISLDATKIYMKGNKSFGELLEMIYERMFKFNDKRGNYILKYGSDITKKANDMIEDMPHDLDKKKKEEWEVFLNGIKKCGESFRDTEKWRQLIELEKIACNACKEICLDLKEEELMGLFAEGIMRKSLKVKLGEDEISSRGYLEYITISAKVLLGARKEHGGEVMKELVMQMLLGKKGEEIDKRYVDRVAGVVRERQRRREREIEKNMKELLRDEEKAKSKKKGKKKSVGVSEAKEEEKKESGTEEVEASEEVGIPSVEVGGARRKTGKKSKGDQKRFKIHSRVLRWRKSPEKIKEEWDRGSEERWKGRSLEEIKEQKIVHDITGVLELLRSEDADRFFMDAGEHMKGGSERQRMVAIGALETGGQRMTGVVEVGTFKDGDGCPVVYHLRFRPTSIGSIGDVINPGVVEASDVGRVDEGEECEDADKFVYPKGVRFETVKETGSFQIVWKNPSDTSEVLRRLIVYCRPCVI